MSDHYMYEGDVVDFNGIKYIAEEGVLVVLEDERTEIEKRLDDLEARLEKLENITLPAYNPYSWPDPVSYQPYVPGTTWTSAGHVLD